VSRFLADTYSVQNLENTDQARAAGRAFARYQHLLADLPGPELNDPIPGFLSLDRYLAEFDAAAPPGVDRGSFIAERASLQAVLQETDDYIHGDCKVNNLLFVDGGNDVGGVVDLDTTMRGHWAWDFGDLVRSAASEAGTFSLEKYERSLEGFLEETNVMPTADELVLSPRYVTLMLGVRHLSDHLEGDRYFKVDSTGDNLRRAEAQFSLLESREAAVAGMRNVAGRILGSV